MRNFVPCLQSQMLARAALVVLGASALGACSSDTGRFGDPFGNPFSTSQAEPAPKRDPEYTGGIQAAPSGRVERAPLGSPSAAQSRPLRGYEQNANSNYGAPSSEPRSTGALQPIRSGAQSANSNWSGQGGSTVTLRQGETVTTLSNRYGVPASAILQANGLQSANGVGPGQQLVIPNYSGAAGRPVASTTAPMSQPRVAQAPVQQPAPAAGQGRMQLVTGAQPKGMEPLKPAPVKTAAKPAVDDGQAFAAAPKPATTAPQPNDNVKTASLKTEEPAPAAAPSGPSFRWPVRGRVISGYGSKASGASNDGVNIAVPEGTEVKASDDGVVAYAGSELKGFGNLVLIRHSNGWVTAYAHNSAIEVKRGDTVRRGQVISKSGSTGNVSTPQLHFEVRKGSATVNPLDHLPNA